jgi:olfactory receptor
LLSFIDICFSSFTAPKLIFDLLAKNKTISYAG